MTERSRFWNSTGPGDASEAPYDAPTEFAQVLIPLSGASNRGDKSGAVRYTGVGAPALDPTVPGANTLRVNNGQAFVYGTWYETDANVDVTIPTPAGSTRIDRVVLRKSWAAQTVRVTRIAGAEGGAAPAITQVVGTTWDMPICQVSITTGAVMTVTDERPWIGGILSETYLLRNLEQRRIFREQPVFDGWLDVVVDNGTGARFYVRGGVNAVSEVSDPFNGFATTLGSGALININWNSTEYQIENRTGATRRVTVHLLGLN